MATMTYDGSDVGDVQIESETNPWVEVDGVPVDWTKSDLPRVPCPCGEGFDVIEPGVLEAMDSNEGIQRCDACGTYDGDLSAALALAKRVGGTVHFHTDQED